jgi:hypothetical protein
MSTTIHSGTNGRRDFFVAWLSFSKSARRTFNAPPGQSVKERSGPLRSDFDHRLYSFGDGARFWDGAPPCSVTVKGTDFTVGIVHGRALSGDWGVSFIRKTVKDGSTIAKIDQQCGFSNGCFQKGNSFALQSTSLNGVEIHKFVPFGTIHERVQIGMNFAGGVGAFKGNVTKTTYKAQTINNANPPAGQQVVTTTNETIKDETSISTLPLLKIELAVSIIAAPALKIRVQGGADLPGYEIFSIVGVYFIGAK